RSRSMRRAKPDPPPQASRLPRQYPDHNRRGETSAQHGKAWAFCGALSECKPDHDNMFAPISKTRGSATGLVLVDGRFDLTYELINFPRDLFYSFPSLCVFCLSRAIGQLTCDSAVWWFEPAQSELRRRTIHPAFISAIFVSKPAPDSNDPVFIQLLNIEFDEAPAASQVVLRLFHALVLEEYIDNRLKIFPRIIGHRVNRHSVLVISTWVLLH